MSTPLFSAVKRFGALSVVFLGCTNVLRAQECGLDARNQWDVPLPQIGANTMPAVQAELIRQGYRLVSVQFRAQAGEQALRRAMTQATAANDKCAEALAAFGLGQAARTSDMAVAVPLYRRAEELFREVGTPLALAYTHERLATAAHFTGDNAGFLRDEPQAEKELADGGDKASAILNRSQAMQWAEGEQRPDAQAALLKELEAVETPNRVGVRGFVEWNAGSSMRRSGRYDQILKLFQASLADFQACDCLPQTRAALLLTLSVAAQAQHDTDSALDYAQQGDAIYRKLELKTLRPQALRLIAGAYAERREWTRAIATFDEGLRVARETNSVAAVPNLGLEEAAAYGDSGEPVKGLAVIDATFAKEPTPMLRCAMSAAKATLDDQAQRYADAVAEAKTATGDCRKLLQPSTVAVVLSHWANAEDKSGHPEDGLEKARESIRIVDTQRERVQRTDSAMRAFNDQKAALYGVLIGTLIQLNRAEDALLASEEFRARAFVDLAESHGSGAPPARPAPDVAASFPLRGGRPPAQSLRSDTHAFSLTIADIRASLAEVHSTLVSYWITPDKRLYTWVMAPEQPVFVHDQALNPVLLASLLKAVQPAEGAGTRGARFATRGGTGAMTPVVNRKPWRDLYGLLIAPIADRLPQEPGSLLTVVPQGQLFHLPFAALLDPAGHYLVERYAVNTVPAAGVLQITAKNDAAAAGLAKRFVLLANPQSYPAVDGHALPALPGTAAEVRGISHELSGQTVTVLEGRQAGIDTLIEALPQATVLHMATHAVVSDHAPLKSFLALDRGQHGGLLTAASIYDLHMTTSLVVLSACSTGRGQISGDGVEGLGRAFFYAGAASLVTTLWDVVDEPTALLMPRFYAGMAKGKSRSAALREAQLSVIADLRLHKIRLQALNGSTVSLPENPAFWAAFSLSGQP